VTRNQSRGDKQRICGLVLTLVVAMVFWFSSLPAIASEPSAELVEAAKKEGKLVYWGTDAETAPKFSKDFEKKYPFMAGKIEFWDAKSNEVVERIVTEAKAGRHSADFISINEGWMKRVEKSDLLLNYDWPNVKSWGSENQPNHGFWANLFMDPRPAIFNTELIPPHEAPKSLEGLINAKWKGLSALSDASEEFPFIYAYLWKKGDELNWEKSFDFFRRLVETTKPAIVNGYTGPTRLLAAGEFGLFHIGLFSRAYQLIKKGAPVGLVPLKPMYVSNGSFAIAKNAPHPNAARLYAYWLTSTRGSIFYANHLGRFPVDPTARDADPVRTAEKYGITGSIMTSLPTEAWTKDVQRKSEQFYLKLLGLK
jgi:iron(III) transport system substrate-binding protein